LARNARELLLGSELINAERAKEIGLVNSAVARDDVISEAQKFAESVLQGAPDALAQTKRLIDELW
jgi:methylglutaconyl-CoA hydratase